MKRKNKTAFLSVFISAALLFYPAAAEENGTAEGFCIDRQELYESLGLSDKELYDSIDPETENILEENGITLTDPGSMTEISPIEVIKYIGRKFIDGLGEPMRLLGIMTAAAALSAAVSAVSDTAENKKMTSVYETISVLIIVSAVSAPISNCLSEITAAIRGGGNFMFGYIPVFAGIAASSGTVTGAAVYDIAVEAAAECAVQISARLMMPLLSVCMAAGITDGINPRFSLSAFTSFIGKTVSFVMVTAVTIFTGMLSLQSTVGTSADTIGAKAAKLAVANFVPVIGGALSDTYAAVRSGLTMLKSAAGFFGIAAIALTVLPPMVSSVSLYISLNIGSAAAEILAQDKTAKFLKNSASVVGTAMSILVCFAALLIISTAMLMSQNIT